MKEQKEQIIFTSEFFANNIQDPADLARIEDLLTILPPGRTAKKELINIFSDLPKPEVAKGVVDTESEWIKIKLQQAMDRILRPWLKIPNFNGAPLPNLTVIELARKSGLSAAKVIELVNNRDGIVVSYGGRNYQARCDTTIPPLQAKTNVELMRRNSIGQLVPISIKTNRPIKYSIGEFRNASQELGSVTSINPKRVIKGARYESRSPKGGPIQRARFQEQKVTGQIIKMAQEKARIVFDPVNQSEADSQPLDKLNKIKETINPAIAEVVDWFEQKGGKKWLRGVDRNGLIEFLLDLAKERETDVIVWNCFDFDWKQKRPYEYPACIIGDDVDESIVTYNYDRLQEAIDRLSLLGPINPVVLVPTNEANAPVWKYIQTPNERETIVNSIVQKLQFKLDSMFGDSTPRVMRWDDYLVSRGLETRPEMYSCEGKAIIDKRLSDKRKIKMIKDDRAYFRQFGMTISDQESAERVPYYFGVYVGEGIAFAEIVRSGRNILVLDFEEFRVGEMTALGAGGIFPIVSPLSAKEKLNYYLWKKNAICSRQKEEEK